MMRQRTTGRAAFDGAEGRGRGSSFGGDLNGRAFPAEDTDGAKALGRPRLKGVGSNQRKGRRGRDMQGEK